MAGKLEELSYEMSRYHWNILGLCKVQLYNRKTLKVKNDHRSKTKKNFGETSTEEGHKLYFSGKEDKHKQGALDFLFTGTL